MTLHNISTKFSSLPDFGLSLPKEVMDLCSAAETNLCDVVQQQGEGYNIPAGETRADFGIIVEGAIGQGGEPHCKLIKAIVDNGEAIATVLEGQLVRSKTKFSIVNGGSRTTCVIVPRGYHNGNTLSGLIRSGASASVAEFLNDASEVFDKLSKTHHR